MAMGSLVLGIIRGELALWRGAMAIAIAVVARVAAWKRKLTDRQRVVDRDKGDWRQCQVEGRTIPR
jgi:hypothetical protein